MFFLFNRIKGKERISFPLFSQNNLINKFIDNLYDICSNNELLSHYRLINYAEIIFYLIILLLVRIFY